MVQIVNLFIGINFGSDFSAVSDILRGWRDWGKVEALLQPTDQEGEGKKLTKRKLKKKGKTIQRMKILDSIRDCPYIMQYKFEI